MDNLDAAAAGQFLSRLALVTPEQLQEALFQVGKSAAADVLLRYMERKGHMTPWQTAKVYKMETDGYFLGGYRILYKVASGSFGRVFRADDPRTNRVVAVKILRRRWSEDQMRIELFQREAKVGLSLQ